MKLFFFFWGGGGGGGCATTFQNIPHTTHVPKMKLVLSGCAKKMDTSYNVPEISQNMVLLVSPTFMNISYSYV